MTRSELLCHLMISPYNRTPKGLTRAYGNRWKEPMTALIDLELVVATYSGSEERIGFHVIRWRGINERAA